jgi:hypothetical protein
MPDRPSAVHLPGVAGMAGVVAVVGGAYLDLSLAVTVALAAAAAAGAGTLALLGATAVDDRHPGTSR